MGYERRRTERFKEERSSRYKAYVAAMIDDVCTVGMVDSGNSFRTAISKELAERLGVRTEELKTVPGKEMVGTAEDGAQLKVLGQVRKRLTLRLSADSPTIVIKPFVS